jgi:type II secretory pathway pseudopilin PulG
LSSRLRHAFSLVEVVLAVGVFAASIVAILALLQPGQKRVEDQFEGATARSLVETIQAELERIGFSAAADVSMAINPIVLVATADGSRICVLSDPDAGGPIVAQADNQLDDPALPGMAERDRYFLVQVFRHADALDLPVCGAGGETGEFSGFLALRAEVRWPFHQPLGPPSGTVFSTGANADPFAVAPVNQRRLAVLNFALRR